VCNGSDHGRSRAEHHHPVHRQQRVDHNDRQKLGAVGATGAASFELPLPLSAGRGWDPQLSLTYSSQAGNGPFGIGWSLGIGQISRRTAKGVPRYSDLDEIIGDDGEVWHPELNSDGTPKSRLEDSYNAIPVGYHNVVRYWPRVERDFACASAGSGRKNQPSHPSG
jgi:hypothetical protein